MEVTSQLNATAACSAYNCGNLAGTAVAGTTFHRFPIGNAERLMKWLTAMKKEKWVPSKPDVLCSSHFVDDMFIESSGYKILTANSVPTKFEVLASPKELFPSEWLARLLSIKDIETDNWKGYVIEARIPVPDKETFDDWLKSHRELTDANFVLLREYPTANKTLSYKAEYTCKHVADDPSTKKKKCPARLLVRIRSDPKFRHQKSDLNPSHSASYPCNVVLYHMHTHTIKSNKIEISETPTEEVSTVVKQKITEMFKGGYSIEGAQEMHKKDLIEQYPDDYEEVMQDTYISPNSEWFEKFYETFMEEFEWSNEKLTSILNEEIEDINALNGNATITTVEEDIVIVLSTPLMKRAHSMKASGEVVFIDDSGFMERCRCYVYLIMAYSCTEGIPLAVLITTSNTQEILTAGFKLLADSLPSDAFGMFGKQGPEVFLTSNNSALQNSLKEVFPETACLLSAYNMSHEMWKWLWNSDNEIDPIDRGALFSLAYKVMQTKTASDFTKLYNAIEKHHIYQNYTNFHSYFIEIKNVSEQWAVCFKDELTNKENSGIEMASFLLKDKIYLVKAYNLLQLVKYYTETMETYYRQKIVHCINDTLEIFMMNSFVPEMREISDLVAKMKRHGMCEVRNLKNDNIYYVDTNICVCSCPLGLNGTKCRHMYALFVNKLMEFKPSVPSDDTVKNELFWIATGTKKAGAFKPVNMPTPMEISATNEEDVDGGLESTVPLEEPVKGQNKEEARKILDRVTKNIMQKYDNSPSEFHKAIVTAAVNYQNLNNDKEILTALRSFGKTNIFK